MWFREWGVLVWWGQGEGRQQKNRANWPKFRRLTHTPPSKHPCLCCAASTCGLPPLTPQVFPLPSTTPACTTPYRHDTHNSQATSQSTHAWHADARRRTQTHADARRHAETPRDMQTHAYMVYLYLMMHWLCINIDIYKHACNRFARSLGIIHWKDWLWMSPSLISSQQISYPKCLHLPFLFIHNFLLHAVHLLLYFTSAYQHQWPLQHEYLDILVFVLVPITEISCVILLFLSPSSSSSFCFWYHMILFFERHTQSSSTTPGAAPWWWARARCYSILQPLPSIILSFSAPL